MKKSIGIVAIAFALSGCMERINKVLDEPTLSPVGSGLSEAPVGDKLADASQTVQEAYQADMQENNWIGGPSDFFRDARARKRGDLITVQVDINDKAALNNSSNRTKKGNSNMDGKFSMGLFGFAPEGELNNNFSGNSAASGQGSVVRSEKLSVALSAMVRQVMPNGQLFIEGSQEILVNNEKRKLQVAGLVDPRDINPNNSIAYAKIAEARIFYGGEGKVSDVQEPGWGVQLSDKYRPF